MDELHALLDRIGLPYERKTDGMTTVETPFGKIRLYYDPADPGMGAFASTEWMEPVRAVALAATLCGLL